MPTPEFRTSTATTAETYHRFFEPHIGVPVSEELLRVADLEPGAHVVDVACGTGAVARAAARQVGAAGAVTGVDLAPDMLEVARSQPTEGAAIDYRLADAAALPVDDGSCDVALCQMGLMLMAERAEAVGELHRALAPGGRVVVSTPGPMQPRFEELQQAIAEHLDPQLGGFVGAVFSMPDPEQLASLLRDAGFQDVSAHEHTVPLELPAPAEAFWGYLASTPLGPIVASAPAEVQDAVERQVVEAWTPHVVDGTTPVDQPMALATGRSADQR